MRHGHYVDFWHPVGIIAEGIETPAELRTLKGLGVARGQGYHLARPMPLGALANALHFREVPEAPEPAAAAG